MNVPHPMPGTTWHSATMGVQQAAQPVPVQMWHSPSTPVFQQAPVSTTLTTSAPPVGDGSSSSNVPTDDCCIVAEIRSPRKRRHEDSTVRAEASSTADNHNNVIVPSPTAPGVPAPKFTSVYKILTKNAVISWFRLTNADILLHWHKGATVDVRAIHPSGVTEGFLLGDYMAMPDKAKYSLTLPPFTWLAMKLEKDSSVEFAFLSATAVPGYRVENMELGQPQDLIEEAGVLHNRMIQEFFSPNGVLMFSEQAR